MEYKKIVKDFININIWRKYIGLICFFGVLWSQREIFVASVGVGYRILEIVYTICMTMALTKTVLYLLFDQNGNIVPIHVLKCYMGLLLLQVVAFIPMYTQNFMYGDDLWGFQTDFTGSISSGLYFSRPFISFIQGFLIDTSFSSIRYFRIFNAMFLAGFGCILIRYIYIYNIRMAFFFSVMAVASCTAVDCIAYASIYPINSSLMISAVAFVIYREAMESKGKKKVIYFIESGICLFTAFCLYQIGTPIVFLFYIIMEKYSLNRGEGERFKQAFFYMVYYAGTAIFYLLMNKLFQLMTGVVNGQEARGRMIHSVTMLWNKIKWFLGDVYPQALIKIIGNTCGNALFVGKNMFYGSEFTNSSLEIITIFLFSFFIVISICVTVYKKKSLMYGLVGVIAMPLSFYPFLILPESTFLTYYAMPLILLLMWYVADGVGIIVHVILIKLNIQYNIENLILPVFVLIIALQGNYYAENIWVNGCRDSQEYLANYIETELANRDDIDIIIVNGTINPYPGGGHDYVIFCIEDILMDLGYSVEKFDIVQSDNGYYLSTFSDGEIDNMKKKLGSERLTQLLQYYIHDNLYGRWLFNYESLSADELEFLRTCFVKTGQLADRNDHTIFVDLTGFNKRKLF